MCVCVGGGGGGDKPIAESTYSTKILVFDCDLFFIFKRQTGPEFGNLFSF